MLNLTISSLGTIKLLQHKLKAGMYHRMKDFAEGEKVCSYQLGMSVYDLVTFWVAVTF